MNEANIYEFLNSWKDGVIGIGSVFKSDGDYKKEATSFIDKHYAFNESNELIQQLIQQHPSNRTFAAKGLLLMAKNYYALNDAFQATYILENIIKNFSSFDVLTKEAVQLLDMYQRELSKSNASIELQQDKTKKNEN